MREFLIKVMAFFTKEIHDVRRQPRLMLSLVGAPLLVLAAFGATFRSSNPYIRTVMVWPENGIPGVDQEQAERYIGANFTLYDVTIDEDQALQLLNDGVIDVVQVIPDFDPENYSSDDRPQIQIYSNAIDPNVEAWTRSLAFSETNYINRQLLSVEARQAQEKAQGFLEEIEGALDTYITVSESFGEEQIETAREVTAELRPFLDELLSVLPPESMAQASLAPELTDLYRDIKILKDDLDELEGALEEGEELISQERLNSTIEELESLQGTIQIFVDIPSVSIVSPVTQKYTNLRGQAYDLVVFFAPSVLALLVQQMAVTLASLGLVRERQMGSFEMFRVAPLRFTQMLLGKSLAYVLYVTIAGAILTGLMSLLNVPLPEKVFSYLALLVLLAVASVGIGFLISAFSKTDSQAIQLTMLLLLLSIFFTGFFMPITGFTWPAWIIAFFVPMTHAITGFQDVLLRHIGLGTGEVISLVIIILISYGVVRRVMRRQFRQGT